MLEGMQEANTRETSSNGDNNSTVTKLSKI